MIKFGLIGPGSIARKFAQDIKLVEQAELVGVASRNKKRAEEFAQEFDIINSYGSYQELLKSDCDAIYIATPHNFHKEQAAMCLNSKKHVLVEKPITVNTNELNELIELAKQNNVLLMEAMWSRFLPATKRVLDIINSNEIGRLQEIELHFGYELSEDYPEDGRLVNPDLAGGSILDLGVYPVSISNYLTSNSEIEDVSVEVELDENRVDRDCNINIEYKNGCYANLRSSIQQDLNHDGVLTFSQGEIIMKRFYYCQELIINGATFQYPARGEGFVDQIEAFCQTIMDGKIENDIMSYQNNRMVMELLDVIRKKAGVKYPFEKNESK